MFFYLTKITKAVTSGKQNVTAFVYKLFLKELSINLLLLPEPLRGVR